MRGVKFAWSLLAATGVVGAAGAASASTTVTVPENISFGGGFQEITLAGASSPQYSFGTDFLGGVKGSYLNSVGGGELGGWSATPSLSASGQKFSTDSVEVAVKNNGKYSALGDYLHMEFAANGVEYLGYAAFDSSGLESITYAPAVPEPASWALLLAGVGLTGAAMRRRRRGAVGAAAVVA